MVILAAHGKVVDPLGTERENTQLLDLPALGAGSDSGIESLRLDAALNPIDHHRHVVLGVWARLERVCAAVGSWDKENLVPSLEGGDVGVVVLIRIHGANWIVVMDR